MIRVLGRQTSANVQKILFLLEELGVKYTREDYGRQFNNTNTDEYRKLNPNIKVPTVIDEDLVIWESNTILRYLAAKHDPALGGSTPKEKSYVERWMDWQLSALYAPFLGVFRDARKPAAERSAEFATQCADLIAQMNILEGHLAGKSWVAVDRLTIADICLSPVVKRCLEFPIDKPPFPELTRWTKAIEARPSFAVALGTKPSTLVSAA